MQLAFAYIRRSSYKQQENNSVEIQKSRILEFAQRKNIHIPEEYIVIEDVTSAYTKAAAQRKMLMFLRNKMIETGINTIIFNEESRMDRTGYTFVLDFYSPLYEHFGDIHIYTTESEKVWDPNDMSVQFKLLQYRQESEIKSERAVGALKDYLQNTDGHRPGSKVPYGYKQTQQKLELDQNSEVVSFIFYLHSWGVSMKKIASILNHEEIPSPKKGEWGVSTIETILKNPIYLGNLHWHIHKGSVPQSYLFSNSHPPIVSKEVVNLIRLNTDLQKRYGRLDTPFLLLNKLKCECCSEMLQARNSSTHRNGKKYDYRYYVCKKCAYKIELGDIHTMIYSEISGLVQRILESEEIQNKVDNSLHHHIEFIDSELATIEEKLNKLVSKAEYAENNNKREILNIIIQKRDSLFENRALLWSKQELTESMIDSLNNGTFLKRFELFDYSLANNELRLIILYFVDTIMVSPSKPPIIIPATDILRDVFDEPDE